MKMSFIVFSYALLHPDLVDNHIDNAERQPFSHLPISSTERLSALRSPKTFVNKDETFSLI